MDKNDYLNKYSELIQMADEKEAKLEAFVQNWLNGNSGISSAIMEETIIKVNEQIAQLKSEAQNYLAKFEIASKEEQLKEEQLQSSNTSKMILRDRLGVDTSNIVITDGVLSSNASGSHLIGRVKTLEEIELDKQIALSTLREKVARKEISLAEASKIKNDIELAYSNQGEISSEIHR